MYNILISSKAPSIILHLEAILGDTTKVVRGVEDRVFIRREIICATRDVLKVFPQ